MKIIFAFIVLSLMTGCASGGFNGSYQERQIQRKCSASAQSNAQSAYIRRESTVRFAQNYNVVQKANIQYQKRMDSIRNSFDNCLANGQRQIFEKNLRRQMSYSAPRYY